jgi:glycosyltransferase involved in cell wall biosynthesis
MDDTYAWDKVEGAHSFTRLTLTPRYRNHRSWRRRLHRQITRALNQIKPDVVAVPGWSHAEACSALFWCHHTNTPVVLMSESCQWDADRSPHKEWLKRRFVSTCPAALVGGNPHRDYLVSLGMQPDKIFLGYDAVDNEHFHKGAEESRRQKAENQHHLSMLPERYFLASARFVQEKNLSSLINAFARYRELALTTAGNLKPWDLVLLGDGPLRPALEALVSALALERHVLMPGFKQYYELPAYYAQALAFVHASTIEPWGLVVNEAMASGLPVLVSNRCGCAQDLVQEGINGFTFDPFNTDQLAQLMSQLSTSNFQLSTFASASRQIITSWGPERFARGLHQAVEVALKPPRPRPRVLDQLLLRLLLLR